MNIKRCSTCICWGADTSFCYYKLDQMDVEEHCPSYRRAVCSQCGGTLEQRTDGVEVWYHCFSCNFDFVRGDRG